MKTSIQGIVILCLAGCAHWEDAHGCLVTVIGDILDNCEARTTVGAVNEGMVIPPVSRVEEFTQTVITGGTIRRNERIARGARLATRDREDGIVECWYQFGGNRIDPCQGWNLLAQCMLKAVERLGAAFDLDGHAVAVIQHKTDQAPAQRLSIDERPEAHALDDTLDDDSPSLNCL